MSEVTGRPLVERLKELVHRDAFAVAGPSAVFSDENKHDIPALWPRLIKCLPLKGQVDARTYGVCWMADKAEGRICYIAGVEVTGDGELPEGFARIAIAAQSYAVFRLNLDGSALHPQMQAAMPEIWGRLIGQSGLKPVPSPDFELYPADFNPAAAGMHVDVYVPVAG